MIVFERKNRGFTEISNLKKFKINARKLAKTLKKKLGCGHGQLTEDKLEL